MTIENQNLTFTEFKTKGSTAAERFSSREPAEEGEVLSPVAQRKTHSNLGDEIVTRSSTQPLEVKPLLEKTPKELSLHRDDIHTRAAHQVADPIIKGGGWLDGAVEGAGHTVTELTETGAFIFAKFVFGLKHGFERGKASGTHKE